jgi:hypothetical protein
MGNGGVRTPNLDKLAGCDLNHTMAVLNDNLAGNMLTPAAKGVPPGAGQCARPEAGEVYGAMDMDWAKLAGQMAHAYRR